VFDRVSGILKGFSDNQQLKMAPAQGAGRILNFFRKPLLIMPCCGNNNYITEPTATRPEEPDSTSQLNRLRPSSLQTEEVPVSRREEPDAEHPYHCPICMDYFSGSKHNMVELA
jgi:hypothetical protein